MPQSILIIEDQDADYEAVVRGLRRNGVETPVTRCVSADDALDYLFGRQQAPGKTGRPVPTLVLLDLKLEGSAGQEVLVRVREDPFLKTIPIIVWSGSNNPHDVEISYRLGANSFIRKTFDFAEINQTLERFAKFWLETAVLPTGPETRHEAQ
jgi:CheY-like chemotaxis protein